MRFVSRREFLAASAAAAMIGPAGSAEPKKLVLIAGSPSHGPGAHEFNAGVQLLAKCLKDFPGLEASVNLNGWPKRQSVFDGAAAILLYMDGGDAHPAIQGDHRSLLGGLMQKGVGLMCAHYGVEVPKDKGGREFQDWIGGYYEHAWSVNPIWRPEFKEFPKHPIANGLQPFSAEDEWYFNMRFRPELKGVTPILTAVPLDKVRNGPYVYPHGPYKHIQDAKGRPEHMMWAVERPDGGRGVGFTGGHFHTNWKNDHFRKAVLNALVWTCKLDVPQDGVESTVSDEEIKQNLDPKPERK
ncbi:MAG TPA: ThuA domain-containing protein [Gemmataceae bacterium]|nr:ThuA domain-containing protein [Gemmataceae bacterium]